MPLLDSAAQKLAAALAPALKAGVDELAAVETPALAAVIEKALADLAATETHILDLYKIEISFVRKG